jgi:aminoglycoside phosphotransferase (APT) family kinase protein
MRSPGVLIASGRDSDIFEYGPALVLRRSRSGHSMALEARTMEYARNAGFPVPAVSELSADGCDLVMQRLDGPVMMARLGRRPWTIGHQGSLLAELHRRLHEIEAPEWAVPAPSGSGDRLLHLDLHPLNVILTPTGPMVIDWTRASRGDPLTDVALTWVLLASAAIPAGRLKAAALGWGRDALVRSFLAPFDRDLVRSELAAVVAWKSEDPNMSEPERRAMQALVTVQR